MNTEQIKTPLTVSGISLFIVMVLSLSITDIVNAETLNTGEIKAIHSSKCLDVSGASYADGANVLQYGCHDGDNQQWTFHNGEIKAIHSSKCLDISGESPKIAVNVVQNRCDNSDDQQWIISNLGEIMPKRNTGLCLDVNGNSSYDGANVMLWVCNGQDNQGWIVPDQIFVGYLSILNDSVTVYHSVMKVQITTDGIIPMGGEKGAFGYGILTNGTNNVLALTSHLCASDSLQQGNSPDDICPNPVGISLLVGDFTIHDDASFHAHVLDLKSAEKDCTQRHPDSDLEVDFTSTVSSGNNVSPDWMVQASGNEITVGNIALEDIDDRGVEAIVSFTILPIVDDGNEITNLCIDLG